MIIKFLTVYLALGPVLSIPIFTSVTSNNFSEKNLITNSSHPSNNLSTDLPFNSPLFIKATMNETQPTDTLADEVFFTSMNISNNTQTEPVQNSSSTKLRNQTLFSLTFPDTLQYVSASLETLKDFSRFFNTEITNTSKKLDFSTSAFGNISQSPIQVDPELQIEIYGLIILSRFSLLKRLFAGSTNISLFKDLVVSIIGADSRIEIETTGRSKYSLILFYSSNSDSILNVTLDEEIKGIVKRLFVKQSQLEKEADFLNFSLLIDVNEMEIKANQVIDINGRIIKFECWKEKDQSFMTCQKNDSQSGNSSLSVVDLSPEPTNLTHKIYITKYFLFLVFFCYWF